MTDNCFFKYSILILNVCIDFLFSLLLIVANTLSIEFKMKLNDENTVMLPEGWVQIKQLLSRESEIWKRTSLIDLLSRCKFALRVLRL